MYIYIYTYAGAEGESKIRKQLSISKCKFMSLADVGGPAHAGLEEARAPVLEVVL